MVIAVTLATPPPSLVRVKQVVIVSGHARHTPRGTTAALEFIGAQGQKPTRWTIVAKAPVRPGGAFTLSWHVKQPTGIPLVDLRVAAVHGGRTVAASRRVQSAIGPAFVPCKPPTAPAVNVPTGDGWITGGLYIQGGPFPGVDECEGSAYTITATNAQTGAVAATQTVPGGGSYTLVVPAGSYTLSASANTGCPGNSQPVSVTADTQVTTDTYCDVP